jgi:hypothetical protein
LAFSTNFDLVDLQINLDIQTPLWPLMAFDGLCWPLLAFAGLYWPLLAFWALSSKFTVVMEDNNLGNLSELRPEFRF